MGDFVADINLARMTGIANPAAFIEANMPLSRPAPLTLQKASELAQCVDSYERP